MMMIECISSLHRSTGDIGGAAARSRVERALYKRFALAGEASARVWSRSRDRKTSTNPLPLPSPTPQGATAFAMKPTKITEAARSVHLLQIDGFSATLAMSTEYIETLWNVDGYDWEVRVYPVHVHRRDCWVALRLVILSEPRTDDVRVVVKWSCRLVDPTQDLQPSDESSMYHVFHHRQNQTKALLLEKRDDIESSGYLKDDSLIMECTITVLKEPSGAVIILPDVIKDDPLPPLPTVPSSDLHQHLGELLESHKGTDVTFVLASGTGERFPAHKSILAARSPVFMAEFFGQMEERTSQLVEIHDMEPAVFEAMLRFIYTDLAPPELNEPPPESETTAVTTPMAQHLLAAADRYGLGRLKLICETKLAGAIDVGTAATTLALAEQHSCSLLKARCVEFVTGSPETLDAVLATEGYTHLAASCPLLLAELLKAARGRKN